MIDKKEGLALLKAVFLYGINNNINILNIYALISPLCAAFEIPLDQVRIDLPTGKFADLNLSIFDIIKDKNPLITALFTQHPNPLLRLPAKQEAFGLPIGDATPADMTTSFFDSQNREQKNTPPIEINNINWNLITSPPADPIPLNPNLSEVLILLKAMFAHAWVNKISFITIFQFLALSCFKHKIPLDQILIKDDNTQKAYNFYDFSLLTEERKGAFILEGAANALQLLSGLEECSKKLLSLKPLQGTPIIKPTVVRPNQRESNTATANASTLPNTFQSLWTQENKAEIPTPKNFKSLDDFNATFEMLCDTPTRPDASNNNSNNNSSSSNSSNRMTDDSPLDQRLFPSPLNLNASNSNSNSSSSGRNSAEMDTKSDSPAPKVKNEIAGMSHEQRVKFFEEAVIILRGKSKCDVNCAYLCDDLLGIMRTGVKPSRQSVEEAHEGAGHTISYANGLPSECVLTYDTSKQGKIFEFPPPRVTVEMKEGKEIEVCSLDEIPMNSATNTDLEMFLRTHAKLNGGYVCGRVVFHARDKSGDHVIPYMAFEDIVYYIEAQNLMGGKRDGKIVFHQISDPEVYPFRKNRPYNKSRDTNSGAYEPVAFYTEEFPGKKQVNVPTYRF